MRLRATTIIVTAGLLGAFLTSLPQGVSQESKVKGKKATAAAAQAARCLRAEGAITIDGRADEPAWAGAELLDQFSPHWLNRPAATATRARLLWDDESLYFFADMDDKDLYADIQEHDGMTWLNDVFELFFKPSDTLRGYYEFQVNAANTKLDMFLPSRGSGGYGRFAREGEFHMETAVVLRGTLNDWHDDDEGWSVEGRIPWSDFAATGGRPEAGQVWRFSLCRYDYSVAFERTELSTTSPLTQPDFHHYEDFGRLRFVGQ